MNKHIETMKKQINDYKALYDAAEARVKQITEDYGEEAGKREQERQDKKLQTARAAAQAAISEAYKEGTRTAREWGAMDGSKLTDDVKLLDGNLVSPADFEELKKKHSGNAMMLKALRQYGEKQNAAAVKEAEEKGDKMAAFGVKPYKVQDIVTVSDKLETWERAQKAAVNCLDMVDGSGNYSDSWTRAFTKEAGGKQLETFGEDEAFSIL